MMQHSLFFSKVDTSGECHIWTGAISDTGYGAFKLDGKLMGAHRAAWIIAHGPIPGKAEVCHSCDVRSCVNPAHLWLGAHEENMDDMVSKKRHWNQSKELCPRGHRYDETARRGNGKTFRRCGECRRTAQRRYDRAARG